VTCTTPGLASVVQLVMGPAPTSFDTVLALTVITCTSVADFKLSSIGEPAIFYMIRDGEYKLELSKKCG
jgi:hypothetical protein